MHITKTIVYDTAALTKQNVNDNNVSIV